MSAASPRFPRIAIVGAGIAGIACGRRLLEAGLAPVLFDKGRGVGGRLATRRAEDGLQFDHGAQYLTARSPSFQAAIEAAEAVGAAMRWADGAGEAHWVGAPGMSGLAKHLGAALDIRLNALVEALSQDGEGWALTVNGAVHHFDRVVLTPPAPQTFALLGDHPLAGELTSVRLTPCLTLMAALSSDAPRPFISRRDPKDALSWIARDSSKPGRPDAACWVAQASPDWSAAHLELEKDEFAAQMAALLCARLGASLSQILHQAGHRWRYAAVAEPLGRDFARSEDRTLYAGGDWAIAPRAEAAWTSGEAIARDLLSA